MNGSILGQVVTGPDAQPVGGAAVTLQGPPPRHDVRSLRSRADGAFTARHLAPGLWRLSVDGTPPVQVEVLDWAATPVRLQLPTPQRRSLDIAQAPSPEPALDHGPEPWRERPLTQHAHAEAWQDGDEGQGLPCADPAATDLAATDDWMVQQATQRQPHPGQHPPPPQRPSRRQGSVQGWVREAGSGTPAAWATISCHSSSGSAPDLAPLSDAQGFFAIDGLSEGLWILRAHAESGATGESVVAVRAGQRSQLTIELDAPGGPDSLSGAL